MSEIKITPERDVYWYLRQCRTYITALEESLSNLSDENGRLKDAVKKLNGPFDGAEGLDSFTLATVIGWFEASLPPTPEQQEKGE